MFSPGWGHINFQPKIMNLGSVNSGNSGFNPIMPFNNNPPIMNLNSGNPKMQFNNNFNGPPIMNLRSVNSGRDVKLGILWYLLKSWRR